MNWLWWECSVIWKYISFLISHRIRLSPRSQVSVDEIESNKPKLELSISFHSHPHHCLFFYHHHHLSSRIGSLSLSHVRSKTRAFKKSKGLEDEDRDSSDRWGCMSASSIRGMPAMLPWLQGRHHLPSLLHTITTSLYVLFERSLVYFDCPFTY